MNSNLLKVLSKAADIANYWNIFEKILSALKLGKNGDNFEVSNKISIKNKFKVLEIKLRDQTEDEKNV